MEEFFKKMFKVLICDSQVLAAGGTTSEPHFMVPFSRSEDFVGRGDVLEKLEISFTVRDYQPRAALWGLGGIG